MKIKRTEIMTCISCGSIHFVNREQRRRILDRDITTHQKKLAEISDKDMCCNKPELYWATEDYRVDHR